jgi:hypothetical protein
LIEDLFVGAPVFIIFAYYNLQRAKQGLAAFVGDQKISAYRNRFLFSPSLHGPNAGHLARNCCNARHPIASLVEAHFPNERMKSVGKIYPAPFFSFLSKPHF